LLANIVNGRSDPERPWEWYDYGMLMGLGVGTVLVIAGGVQQTKHTQTTSGQKCDAVLTADTDLQQARSRC
jgi:hypothetical protein